MLSHASEFINMPASAGSALSESVSEEDVRVSLLDEVEGSLGKGSASSRLSQMEASLRPIVAALPKNAHGNLEPSAVSYALHRLFVLRHGWNIKGLGTEAVLKNSSSPTHVLKDQVPSYIVGLFEKGLAGKGLRLHETAVLAATIEHLIHNEAVSRLGSVFNVLKLLVTSPISTDEASKVLNTYMATYIQGEALDGMTLEMALQLNEMMPDVFPAWKDTQEFVDGVRKSIIKDEVNGLEFASLALVVEAVGEQFGTFQDWECRQMKETMVKMEYRGTGRVRLADFYNKPASGAWQFQESSAYLRALGALDESDPTQPSVMLANYIAAPTNCIASSGFYSVCCKSECEGLQGHLEEKIGAPEAKADDIATLISFMPFNTATKLSTKLRQRLDEIAAHHEGMVPLHGRLFAQWMHHVYPRECPYPHISGTTDSKLPEEWLETADEDGIASEEEMKQHVASPKPVKFRAVVGDLAVEDLMPWSHEEELIAVNHAGLLRTPMSGALRSLLLLAAAGSAVFALTKALRGTVKSALGTASLKGDEKYMV